MRTSSHNTCKQAIHRTQQTMLECVRMCAEKSQKKRVDWNLIIRSIRHGIYLLLARVVDHKFIFVYMVFSVVSVSLSNDAIFFLRRMQYDSNKMCSKPRFFTEKNDRDRLNWRKGILRWSQQIQRRHINKKEGKYTRKMRIWCVRCRSEKSISTLCTQKKKCSADQRESALCLSLSLDQLLSPSHTHIHIHTRTRRCWASENSQFMNNMPRLF